MKKTLGVILFFTTAGLFAAEPKIKVKIADSLKSVVVSGRDVQRYIKPKNSTKTFPGKKTINFNCNSKVKRKKNSRPVQLATMSSYTGLLQWNKKHYNGKLHIQTSENFDGCDLIHEMDLEEYIKTLLPKEMSTTWPLEALKAQAVAARSYALYKIKMKQVSKAKGYEVYYDLENSEKHQVNGHFFDITKKTQDATKETHGEVLTLRRNKLAPIFFHSKCGGKTLRPDQVWSNRVDGYVGVDCPFCHSHGMKKWTREFDKKQLFASVYRAMKRYNGEKLNRKEKIELIDDHKSQSRVKFYCEDDFKTLRKSRIRATMGRKNLPSNYFHIREKNNKILVSGSGYGHGVGLCQFGAKELALKGFSYKQILAHYFPEFKLKKIYK